MKLTKALLVPVLLLAAQLSWAQRRWTLEEASQDLIRLLRSLGQGDLQSSPGNWSEVREKGITIVGSSPVCGSFQSSLSFALGTWRITTEMGMGPKSDRRRPGQRHWQTASEARKFIEQALTHTGPIGCLPRLDAFRYDDAPLGWGGNKVEALTLSVKASFLMEGYPVDDSTVSAVFDGSTGGLMSYSSRMPRKAVLVKARPASQPTTEAQARAEAKAAGVSELVSAWNHSLKWVVEPPSSGGVSRRHGSRWLLAHVFKKPAAARPAGAPADASQTPEVVVESVPTGRIWSFATAASGAFESRRRR